MIIYMNLCKTKGVLGSRKLWFSYINGKKNQNKIKISARFRLIFDFELSWKSFSSSSGSSQLGSDSSLQYCVHIEILIQREISVVVWKWGRKKILSFFFLFSQVWYARDMPMANFPWKSLIGWYICPLSLKNCQLVFIDLKNKHPF